MQKGAREEGGAFVEMCVLRIISPVIKYTIVHTIVHTCILLEVLGVRGWQEANQMPYCINMLVPL